MGPSCKKASAFGTGLFRVKKRLVQEFLVVFLVFLLVFNVMVYGAEKKLSRIFMVLGRTKGFLCAYASNR